MQAQEAGTITITEQGISAVGAQAETITFYLVNGLDDYCQSQQLDSWCWAASSVIVQNYYVGVAGKHLSTQADICVLDKDKVVSESGNPTDVLVNDLKYSGIDYAQKNTVNASTLLQFLQNGVNEGTPMILMDGTANVSTGHSIVVLGYGVNNTNTNENYIVYFDPYLGYKFPGTYTSKTILYAPFENFLPDLTTKVDKLYRYKAGNYMTPLLNAIPKDSSWSYPMWHVVDGKCDTQVNIPKQIVSNGVTYCIKQDNHSCAAGTVPFYYYPRMTRDQDPLSLNVYYASSVNIKRSGHDYKATLNYGVTYNDPHDEVIVTGTSYNSTLGSELKDFYLYLIPMSDSLLP